MGLIKKWNHSVHKYELIEKVQRLVKSIHQDRGEHY